jgi:leader peptidase (prepilin peptidase)/N-methyltransferase
VAADTDNQAATLGTAADAEPDVESPEAEPTSAGSEPVEDAKPLLGDLREGVVVLVVAACALSFGLFGFSGQGVVTAVSSSVLIVLAAIDAQHRILPNRIVLPAAIVILALQIAFFPDQALEWIGAGVAAAAFLAAPLLIRRDGIGMGDIKLALLLGFAVGWHVFGAILIGCLAMIPVALWMLIRDGSIKGATLPFGPFLAFGTLAILFTS